MSNTWHHGFKNREKYFGKQHRSVWTDDGMSPTRYQPYWFEWIGPRACIVHFTDSPPPKVKRWKAPLRRSGCQCSTCRLDQEYQVLRNRYIRRKSKQLIYVDPDNAILPSSKRDARLGWW